MDNFEKLGFEVEVGGKSYTTALSRLDAIISRLDKINKLQNGQKLNKKGFEHFSKTGELTKADTKSAKRSGNVSVYQDLQKQIAKEIELNHIWKQQVETLTQLNLAKQKKLTYDLLANNEDVKSANVQAEISKIMAKTAIDTGVLAKEEGKLALAKQATVQYDKQSISNMAKLQAEQKALNDGKWEEARRIELANNARKKEIDQRLKQELGIKQITKSLGSYLAKLTSITLVARRLGHFIGDAIQESANYVENLNLFAVAYGDVYEETVDWALNIADAYGLASNEVLKFAGTFRQLSTSLGLVEDTANSVSQTVTQLGYDFSALFNTSVSKAMEALQSSIFSGNVRPLRAFGIDISQNQIDALFETNETLKLLGVNARNLSQSDKVLARLIITLQTGSNAFGTMNREINTLQSQIRILQGSFANFKLAVGDLVQKPVQQALVWLNGLLIAVTKIIRAFHPLQKEDTTPAISNLGEEADEANEALEELNGNLASFDKFNVLNDSKGAGTDLSITEALTEELRKQQELYQAQLDAMGNVENEAKKIAQSILDWLGITDDVDTWSELMDTRFGSILESALLIGGAITTWKVTEGFLTAINTLSDILKYNNSTLVISAVLTLSGIVLEAQGIKDAVQNKLDGFNFAEIVGGSLLTVSGSLSLGAKIATWIDTTFARSKIAVAITEAGINIGTKTVAGTGAAIGGAISAVIVGIPMLFVGIYDAIKEGLNWLNGVLIPTGATLAGAGIGAIIGTLGGPIGALIGLAVGLVTDLVILIVQNWEKVKEFFVNLWNKVVDIFGGAANWFYTKVIEPVVNFFSGLFLRIGQFAEGCWLIIQAVWFIVSTWFNENVITPIVNGFKWCWEQVSSFFVWLWDGIVEIFSPAFEWIDNTIIKPMTEAFKIACEKIGGFFSNLWIGIKKGVESAMNGVIGFVEGAINFVIRGINNLLNGFNKVVEWAANILGKDWSGVTLINEVNFKRLGTQDANDIMSHENQVAQIPRSSTSSSASGIAGKALQNQILAMDMMGNTQPITENINLQVDGRTILTAVRDAGRKQGLDMVAIAR